MALTITDTLTAINGDTYASVDLWEAAHGPCGVKNAAYVTSGTLTLDEGGVSVTRVLVYPDEAKREAHEASAIGITKTWNFVNISRVTD